MTDNTRNTNKETGSYKGFCLFNDITDAVLRTRNRAVVLTNMAEDNSKSKLINAKGASLILGYFQQVPPEERDNVKSKFAETMLQRGFRLTA